MKGNSYALEWNRFDDKLILYGSTCSVNRVSWASHKSLQLKKSSNKR